MNQLTYRELKEWKAANKPFQLIDVREHDEHEAYNIGGQLIPLKWAGEELDCNSLPPKGK